MRRQVRRLPVRELIGRVLLDADVFISFLRGDELSEASETVVKAMTSGKVTGLVSSILYDELISALRSKGASLDLVEEVLAGVAAIPHKALPITAEVALIALRLYREHGGPRKLHYFDSFHVATASVEGIPLVTSDSYILEHSDDFEIGTIDLRGLLQR